MVRLVLFAIMLALAACCSASAADEEKVYGSSDEIFDDLRNENNPGYHGNTVQDALDQFIREGEVDEGSYPASEIWERDFDLRREKPEKPRYTGRTYFKISDDDISGVEKFEKELELGISYSDWKALFRVSDVNAFASMSDPIRFEKASVRWNDGPWKVTVGSFGALFGRGLALNMFEERTLDFDNEAEGFKLERELGDSADATVLWGTHKDLLSRRSAEVTAARVSGDITDELTGGISYVRTEWPDVNYSEENPILYQYDLLGQDLRYRDGDLVLYAETVALQRPEYEIGGTDHDYEGIDGRGTMQVCPTAWTT